MKLFFPLMLFCSTLVAEDVPKWAQMQSAILVQPDLTKVKNLVEGGVDPNAPIGCGTYAPLNGAIQKQNVELVALLLSMGAKPTEEQMVQAAFGSGHQEALQIVKSLHAAGASVNSREYYSGDKGRFTMPLHQAVWRHNTELVAYLLKQKGIELNELNISGCTPLMTAVEHGREDVVSMLLNAGADPLKRNTAGLDAISVANQVIETQTRLKTKLSSPNALGATGVE
jgi:ankyrin repeat protein